MNIPDVYGKMFLSFLAYGEKQKKDREILSFIYAVIWWLSTNVYSFMLTVVRLMPNSLVLEDGAAPPMWNV